MRPHRLDPLSLVFGATFAGLGGLFLFGHADVSDLHLRWTWPIPIIVLGAIIVVLAARRSGGPSSSSGAAAPLAPPIPEPQGSEVLEPPSDGESPTSEDSLSTVGEPESAQASEPREPST